MAVYNLQTNKLDFNKKLANWKREKEIEGPLVMSAKIYPPIMLHEAKMQSCHESLKELSTYYI